jgi:hypothetical protein
MIVSGMRPVIFGLPISHYNFSCIYISFLRATIIDNHNPAAAAKGSCRISDYLITNPLLCLEIFYPIVLSCLAISFYHIGTALIYTKTHIRSDNKQAYFLSHLLLKV